MMDDASTQRTTSDRWHSHDNDPNLTAVPAWRRWVVQWDISHNAIPLAFFAFTAMWQTAASHYGMESLPEEISVILFFTSYTILAASVAIFVTRIVIYPAAIVADFQHPRLMNFFFMPVMIGALLVLTTPTFMRSVTQFRIAFYLLGTYQVMLSVFLFGEWLLGSHPTMFIHPLVFMQTIGFFLLAIVGARIHLLDQAWAMFSVGVLFWLLVFFTNFQHVALALDKKRERPAPTFFLFIAPPAQASIAVLVLHCAELALEKDSTASGFLEMSKGRWPVLAQSFLYVDLFLFLLMLRLFPTFWTSKFSVAWWAYIFPLSAAASATIMRYWSQGGMFWRVMAATTGLIACIAMAVVLSFMLWSLYSHRTPNNVPCLKAYARYYLQRHGQRDGESMAATGVDGSVAVGVGVGVGVDGVVALEPVEIV